MSNLSIRLTLREGDSVRSIDIDTFPAAPALIGFGSPGAEEVVAPPRFTDNGDGTVTDNKTGLMWSKDDVSEERLTWAKAVKACAALRLGSHDDWVVPSREQLLTLVDDTRHSPAIDSSAFPSCKSEWYWTSTPYAPSPSGYAWGVSFSYGYSDGDSRVSYYRVRAVRVASRQ